MFGVAAAPDLVVSGICDPYAIRAIAQIGCAAAIGADVVALDVIKGGSVGDENAAEEIARDDVFSFWCGATHDGVIGDGPFDEYPFCAVGNGRCSQRVGANMVALNHIVVGVVNP